METNLKLGNRVTSKRLGLPTVGTVVGVMTGQYFSKLRGEQPFSLWDNVYKDWQSKCIITVLFDQPQKFVSFDEFKACQPEEVLENITENELVEIYNMLPPALSFIYPEDDLEVF